MDDWGNLNTEPLRAILRADASAEIGLGHVTRSLALGGALVERGWTVTLAAAQLPAALAELSESMSIGVTRLKTPRGGQDDAAEVLTLGSDLVVVDGYRFNTSYFETLRKGDSLHVVIDDNVETTAMSPFAIINQNPHAEPSMYRHLDTSPLLLLGLDYALIRPAVVAASSESSEKDAIAVFVSLGGSDPLGITVRLVERLSDAGIHTRVAVGTATYQRSAVIDRLERLPATIVVDPARLPHELARSELAVVGAGTTMWEAAFLGVPAVGVVVADNQSNPARSAEDLGFVRSIDARAGLDLDQALSEVRALLDNGTARTTMSERGRSAVDGGGSRRVAAALSGLIKSAGKRS